MPKQKNQMPYKKTHLANPDICPHCSASNATAYYNTEVEDMIIVQCGTCGACGATWHDVYRRVDVVFDGIDL